LFFVVPLLAALQTAQGCVLLTASWLGAETQFVLFNPWAWGWPAPGYDSLPINT
jgi:hypothetical protein